MKPFRCKCQRSLAFALKRLCSRLCVEEVVIHLAQNQNEDGEGFDSPAHTQKGRGSASAEQLEPAAAQTRSCKTRQNAKRCPRAMAQCPLKSHGRIPNHTGNLKPRPYQAGYPNKQWFALSLTIIKHYQPLLTMIFH